MRRSIRWKLTAVLLLTAVAPLVLFGLVFERQLETSATSLLERQLLAEARLAGVALAARDRGMPADQVRTIGRALQCRVTVIARDGAVLADSQAAGPLPNHGGRPEVRQAVATGEGASLRRSATLGTRLFYVAWRMADGRVVRLAMTATQLDAELARLRRLVQTWLALTALAVVALSLVVAGWVVGPLRRLTRLADDMAGGDLGRRVQVHTGDELEVLAGSLNRLAASLSASLGEIREDRARVQAILDGLADGVLVVGREGLVTSVNPAAARMLGYPAAELLGLSPVEATRSAAVEQAMKAAAAGDGIAHVEATLQPTGLVVAIRAAALPASEGVVAILSDLSASRRADEVRREFVANASHELRTPIAAIRALAETLEGERDPAVQERFHRRISEHADRLTTLVADLLALAEAEAGPAPEPAQAPLAPVMRAALEAVTPEAEQRQVCLQHDAPAGLLLRAAPERLEQILVNLLENAIRYNRPGGEAGVRAWAENDSVLLEVWDTGLGIPSEHLPRVFERFYRVDKARSRAVGGTGLGLAIVRHLAESLGGSVEVQSELGRGSRFRVRLPAA